MINRLTQLGQLLIALRIANGITQHELVERLGVSESVVSRDERNEYHGITVERAQCVLNALDGHHSICDSTARERHSGPDAGYSIPPGFYSRCCFHDYPRGAYHRTSIQGGLRLSSSCTTLR